MMCMFWTAVWREKGIIVQAGAAALAVRPVENFAGATPDFCWALEGGVELASTCVSSNQSPTLTRVLLSAHSGPLQRHTSAELAFRGHHGLHQS